MLTRRDVMLAAIAAVPAAASVASAQSTEKSAAKATSAAKSPLLSTAFDWEKLDVQKTKVGERRAVFDSPITTLDRLECHITTVNPGEEPHAPHKHPEEELMLVKEGTLDVVQDGVRSRVGPGSVVFNSSNQMHGFRNVGDKPATYFVIKWWSPGAASDKAK